MGGLIGVLIRASFKSDAIFSLVFETILIQLIDRAPRTIFEGTEVAIPGGASLIVLVPQSLSML